MIIVIYQGLIWFYDISTVVVFFAIGVLYSRSPLFIKWSHNAPKIQEVHLMTVSWLIHINFIYENKRGEIIIYFRFYDALLVTIRALFRFKKKTFLLISLFTCFIYIYIYIYKIEEKNSFLWCHYKFISGLWWWPSSDFKWRNYLSVVIWLLDSHWKQYKHTQIIFSI